MLSPIRSNISRRKLSPDRRAQISQAAGIDSASRRGQQDAVSAALDHTIYGSFRQQGATTEPYMQHETNTSNRAKETKSKPWTGEVGKEKENIKLRDLEPSAKGGATDMLKEGSGPKPYYFGKTVTYITRSGKVLDEDAVKRRIKASIPIQVHYSGEGANRIIDRVILDED
jgi:hypothetical protein